MELRDTLLKHVLEGLQEDLDTGTGSIFDDASTFTDASQWTEKASGPMQEALQDRRNNASDIRYWLQLSQVFKKIPGSTHSGVVLERFTTRQKLVGRNVFLKDAMVRKGRSYIRSVIGDDPGEFLDLCRHGPGATAERVNHLDKYALLRQTPRTMPCGIIDPLGRLPPTSLVAAEASRVLVVEKDYRGGRVIAAEPVVHQFLQQGLGRTLRRRLIERGCRHLDDASLHIAMLTKRANTVATVDLSDASDWLSVRLLAALLPTKWLRALFSARTRFCQVGPRLIENRSAATMGNGFCFPLLTLICMCACHVSGAHPRDFSVFGDDIIIADRYYDELVFVLACFGLRVNHAKSFRAESPFAETCGYDLWKPQAAQVRPKFLRSHVPITSTYDIMKLCEFQQWCWLRGAKRTAGFLRKIAPDHKLASRDPLPGAWLSEHETVRTRWNKDTQVLEYQLPGGFVPQRPANLDGAFEFLRWSSEKLDSYESEVMSRDSRLRMRWTRV